jgi:hypothetical protein
VAVCLVHVGDGRGGAAATAAAQMTGDQDGPLLPGPQLVGDQHPADLSAAQASGHDHAPR